MFDISAGKKPGKPTTPSKASKEPEKPAEKEEEGAQEEPAVIKEEEDSADKSSPMEEDELIIKDEIDNDCFEEVDRIGEIEREVKKLFRFVLQGSEHFCYFRTTKSRPKQNS